MSRDTSRNPFLLALVLAGTLVIAGCGSSSDGDMPAEPDPTADPDPDPDAAELERLQAENDRLQAANDRLENEAGALADQEAEEQRKADAAMARGLFTALSAADARDYALTVTSAYGEATKLAVVITDPVAVDPEFKTRNVISALSGWGGTELTSKKGAVEDTARVYTYVAPDKPVSFEKWVASTMMLVELTNGRITPKDTHDEFIRSSAFTRVSGTQTHTPNFDNDNEAGFDVFRVRGYFAGAIGTYECDPGVAGSCVSTATADGYELAPGTWTFTADSNAMAQIADTDPEWYGWWLRDTGVGFRGCGFPFRRHRNHGLCHPARESYLQWVGGGQVRALRVVDLRQVGISLRMSHLKLISVP